MKKTIWIAVIILMAIIFYATSASSSPIVLKAVTMFPKNHLNNDPVHLYVEKVNKACQGRLKIDWLGGPEVIKGFDQPHAIKAGTIDMILYMAFAYCKSLMPEAEAQGLRRGKNASSLGEIKHAFLAEDIAKQSDAM